VRGWYDSVQAYREADLGPQIRRLVEAVAAEQGDQTPGEWVVEWPSLWQMTPGEEADYQAKIAATDKVYLEAQVVLPEEVAVTRFGGGSYSDGPIQIDESVREVPAETVAPVPAQAPATPPPTPEAP
jgi:hypothetical protein